MLISMHKINCITHFFLKILQRNTKLVILGNLDTHQMIVSIWRNLRCFSAGKKSSSLLTFSLTYCKVLPTCCFGYFGHAWLSKAELILSTCRKLSCLSSGKKLISPLYFFWRYCKDMQISYFEYFRHAWLHTPKMILSTCRKYTLNICQKDLSFTFFLKYYILKNPAIWLADSILANNSRTRILPYMGLVSITILFFTSDYFQEQLITKKIQKIQKKQFWGHIGHFLP